MKSLRANIRELHILENRAAEKVGMRFMLLEEKKLFGKKAGRYIRDFVSQLSVDIFPEMLASAKLGTELREAVFHAEEKK